MRIAVASTDGKVVNQHFGKAERFLIFDVNDTISFVESRETEKVCGSSDYGHADAILKKVVSMLKDCEAVLCSRIGGSAASALLASGIEPVETPYFIKDAISLYIKEHQMSR